MRKRVSTTKMPPWVDKATRVLGVGKDRRVSSGLIRKSLGRIEHSKGMPVTLSEKTVERIGAGAEKILNKYTESIARQKNVHALTGLYDIVSNLTGPMQRILNMPADAGKRRNVLVCLKNLHPFLAKLESLKKLQEIGGAEATNITRFVKAVRQQDFYGAKMELEKLADHLTEDILKLDKRAWNEYKNLVGREAGRSILYPSTTFKGRLSKADGWLLEEIILRMPYAKSFCDYGSGASKGSPTTIDTRKAFDRNGLKDITVDAADVAQASNQKELKRNNIGFYKADAIKGPLKKRYNVIRVANLQMHLTPQGTKRLLWNLGQSLNRNGVLLFVENVGAGDVFLKGFKRHEFEKAGKKGFALVPWVYGQFS